MSCSQKIYLVVKRCIGFLGSLFGIITCLVFLWWWIFPLNLIATKGHPVFRSERIGQNGKTIKILKFRSMRNDVDPNLTSEDIKGVGEPHTWFGKFLRRTNLDETLQLFNILIGQMAFIGPRPLINYGQDKITIKKRKENGSIVLKPGLSGYAQVHGRTRVSAEEKADLDYYYFKHFSLWLDIKVFVLSIFS